MLARGSGTRRVPGGATRQLPPFYNTAVSFEPSGAELELVARRAFEGRGRSGFEISGMAVRIMDDPDGVGVRVAELRVAGEPLDPERRYRLATNSFHAARGDRLFELGRELTVDDTRRYLLVLLEYELTSAGALRLPRDERILRAER